MLSVFVSCCAPRSTDVLVCRLLGSMCECVCQLLEAELRSPIKIIFSSSGRTPIAVASLAHRFIAPEEHHGVRDLG